MDGLKLSTKWDLWKYDDQGTLCEHCSWDGNLALNEGIDTLLRLLTGAGGVPYSATDAYLGVGDGTTAASATQTGLQGTNKTYKGMDAGYPQISGTSCIWQATFGPTEGNHAWEEFTVANGSSDAAMNLNRKVQSMGTKVSGATWVLRVTIQVA